MRIGWRLLMSCLLTSSRLAVHWQPGMSKVLLTIQAFVTLFFAPMALFWLFGVVTDIIAYGPALTKCAGPHVHDGVHAVVSHQHRDPACWR